MLDFGALENLSKQLEDDRKLLGGDFANILPEWKIEDSVVLKILSCPILSKHGSYFHKKITYKVGGKFYTSKATFQEHCVLDEQIAEYKEMKNDDSIKPLFEDWKNFTRTGNLTYLIPAIKFEMSFNKVKRTEEIKSFEPVIFECKQDTMSAIHSIVVNPKVLKKCGENSIMNRENGILLTFKLNGKKINVQMDIEPMDTTDTSYDELYNDKMPNVLKFLCSQMKSDEHLSSVVSNYFEGVGIVNDDGETKKEYFSRFGFDVDDNDSNEEKTVQKTKKRIEDKFDDR